MDKNRIDSHKLIFHPREVVKWLDGETVYPINLEIGLAGGCNHRCIFCSVDYMQYKAAFLNKDILLRNLRELSTRGLKSVLFAGSGEPLLHPDFVEIVNETKALGIDVALSTNGVLFTPSIAEQCLRDFSWIRFSVSAGTEATYKIIQQGQDGDLERVFNNIQWAAELKQQNGYNTTLNVQLVMIPENMDEIVMLAKKVKSLHVDNFIAKSFGFVEQSKSTVKKQITEEYSGTLVKTKIDKFLNVSGSRHCSIKQQCREVALCWRDVPDG